MDSFLFQKLTNNEKQEEAPNGNIFILQKRPTSVPVSIGRALRHEQGAVVAAVARVALALRKPLTDGNAVQEGATVAGAVDGGDGLGFSGGGAGPAEL